MKINIKLSTAALFAGCAPGVHGHGYLASPRSRLHITNPGLYKNDPVYTLTEGPVFGFSETAMRCRDRPALVPTTTIVAGGSIDYQLNLAAYHIGDCAFYLSTPCNGSSCNAPVNWFKIANFPGCPLTGTINIPPEVPASEHSVLRWEWSAHHVVSIGQVEFYVGCHDVAISSAAGPGRPEPLVAIAAPSPVNHLSSVASDYRDANAVGRAGNMVGPQVAVWFDCTIGTPGCIDPESVAAVPTPAPNTPVPTQSLTPTSPPIPTPCYNQAYSMCDTYYGVDYGCCAEGLECTGDTVKMCTIISGSTSAPTSSPSKLPTGRPTAEPPSNASPTSSPSKEPTSPPTNELPTSASPTERPSGPTPSPNLRPTQPPACNLEEWAVCDVYNGFYYGCCAPEDLVCVDTEGAVGTGLKHCRPKFRCAEWCNEYTASADDCIDCIF